VPPAVAPADELLAADEADDPDVPTALALPFCRHPVTVIALSLLPVFCPLVLLVLLLCAAPTMQPAAIAIVAVVQTFRFM